MLCWSSVLFFSRPGPRSHLSAFAVFRPVFDTDSCACTGTEASPPLLLAVVWAALYSAQHHSCYRMPALLDQPLVLVPFHQLWPTSVETDKKLRVDKLWKGVLPDCKGSAEKTCRSLQPKFPRRMCFKKTLDILIKWFGRENLVLNCQRARSIKHWPESLEALVHSL